MSIMATVSRLWCQDYGVKTAHMLGIQMIVPPSSPHQQEQLGTHHTVEHPLVSHPGFEHPDRHGLTAAGFRSYSLTCVTRAYSPNTLTVPRPYDPTASPHMWTGLS